MSEEIEITEINEIDEEKEIPSKKTAKTTKNGLDKTGKIILIITLVLSLSFILLGAVSLTGGKNSGNNSTSSGGGNRYTSESRGGSRYNSESEKESIYYNRLTVGSESVYSLYRSDRKYFSFGTGYNSGTYYIAVKNCDIIYFEDNNGGSITYRVWDQSSDVKIYRVYLDSYKTYVFGVTPDIHNSNYITVKVLVSSQTLDLDCFN